MDGEIRKHLKAINATLIIKQHIKYRFTRKGDETPRNDD